MNCEEDPRAIRTLWASIPEGFQRALGTLGVGEAQLVSPTYGELSEYLASRQAEENVGKILVLEDREDPKYYGQPLVLIERPLLDTGFGPVQVRFLGVSTDCEHTKLFDLNILRLRGNGFRVRGEFQSQCEPADIIRARLAAEATGGLTEQLERLQDGWAAKLLVSEYADLARVYADIEPVALGELLQPDHEGDIVIVARTWNREIHLSLGLCEQRDIWLLEDYDERHNSGVHQRGIVASPFLQRHYEYTSLSSRRVNLEQSYVVLGKIGHVDSSGEARYDTEKRVFQSNLESYCAHHSLLDAELREAVEGGRVGWNTPVVGERMEKAQVRAGVRNGYLAFYVRHSVVLTHEFIGGPDFDSLSYRFFTPYQVLVFPISS